MARPTVNFHDDLRFFFCLRGRSLLVRRKKDHHEEEEETSFSLTSVRLECDGVLERTSSSSRRASARRFCRSILLEQRDWSRP